MSTTRTRFGELQHLYFMYVHADVTNCRRDYVKKEAETSKLWEEHWGFLPAKYREASIYIYINYTSSIIIVIVVSRMQ